MRFVPLLLFTTALSAFTCHGEPAPRTFLQTGYGFRLALTEDWDNLPPKMLKDFNDQAAKVRSDWARPALHAGYWMTNAPGYAFPPYVLIRAAERGYALDEKTIRDEWTEKGVMPPGVEMDDPVLDTNLNAFVGNVRWKLANAPPLAGSGAVFPTRLGAIKVYFMAAQADVDRHPELFVQVLKGLQIDAENKVGWKPSKLGLWLGLGSIALVALVLWRAKPA